MADNLGTLLTDACRKFAVQPALEEMNDALSYSQLSALSGMVASALRGHGLMRDEPVLVPVANEARDIAAFTGVWLAGGVVVPVSQNSPAIVIEATRAMCGARFFAKGSDEIVRRTSRASLQSLSLANSVRPARPRRRLPTPVNAALSRACLQPERAPARRASARGRAARSPPCPTRPKAGYS